MPVTDKQYTGRYAERRSRRVSRIAMRFRFVIRASIAVTLSAPYSPAITLTAAVYRDCSSKWLIRLK